MRASRLRTKVVCSHHNAVLVFNRENASSRHNGLPVHKHLEQEDEWEMCFDGLGALDSLGKGVLNVVGPLVNRMGSVEIESVVPLQTLHSASGFLNRRKQTYGAAPICWEVIHGGVGQERASVFSSGNVTSLDQL